jgi:outer membrane protein
MNILKKITFVLLLLFTKRITAQDVWSLEKCVAHAIAQSLVVKQATNQQDNARLNERLADFDRYPNVTAGSNLGFNFGRTVNPSTNVFESNNSNFNGFGLSASVLLYNGGRLQETYRQTKLDTKAATADVEQAQQILALQVAQAYLQAVLSEEQLENTQNQLARSQNQLGRLDAQIKAGVFPVTARADLLVQIARIEQQIILAKNARQVNLLTLKNLLQLPLNQPIALERPSVEPPKVEITEGGVLNAALQNQAQIKAGLWRVQSAQVGVKIAKAAMMPTLSMQGNLATNYANLITDPTRRQLIGTRNIDESVRINGQPSTITYTATDYESPKKRYGTQLRDNFGQSLGFNISIPIFDGFSRKIGIERAELQLSRTQMQLEQAKLQLQRDVETAVVAAQTGREVYDASVKILEAQRVAFEVMENRAKAGNLNTFELAQAKNQLDIAERDVTIAKYDYLFRLKILDFYSGKSF